MFGNKLETIPESHKSLYEGVGKGDTWTKKDGPREAAIVYIREKFSGPVKILDIGCGKGLNTKWIAEKDLQSQWVGIDAVSAETIGIDLPKNATNLTFIKGDFLHDNELERVTPILQQPFEIIVDQGAAFVEIDEIDEMRNYLSKIHKHLADNGFFIALTCQGKPGTIKFPDGRKRVFHNLEDFEKPPFSEFFEVDHVESNFGESILPEEPYWPHVKNPMGTKQGDERQLTIAHVFFKKKISTQA